MAHDRRTLLRALGAGSIGLGAVGSFGGRATGATITEVRGGGDDIWGTADAFHYHYRRVSGDFDVTVRSVSIEATDPWAKAGLMVRESLAPDSKNVMARRRPNDEASAQWRATDGGETTSTGGAEADWLRLRRAGDTVTVYHATEAGEWSEVTALGADQVDLSDEVYVGLAVTSHVTGTLCTARFTELDGVTPDSHGDIGDVQVSGGVSATEGVPLVSTRTPTDATPTSLRLAGDLTDLGGASSADCYFEYRRVMEESWTATDARTLTAPGSFAIDADGLTPRRYYEIRAVAETADGDTATGATVQFNTPARSTGGGDAPIEGASHFDPGDGFADAAPWLDDATPVITVTEPTREQLERAVGVDGERLVVFETSGTVDLGGDQLTVSNDRLYLAGQTAPSPGITLVGGRLTLDASDCVLQHVRVRKGTRGPEGEGPSDALQTGDETTNNVIDHLTATWGIDETLSVGYRTQNTTVSNCLVAEALRFPYPDQDTHYGTLIGDDSKNVALMGNVWAHLTNRLPRLKQGTTSAVASNVMYHYSEATNMGETGTVYSSIVGNAYVRGAADSANIEGGNAYLDDNYAVDPETPMTDRVNRLDERPVWPGGLDALASQVVEEHNIANAGARPADRTPGDERVIEDVRTRTGSYIDSQEEVGGYPDLAVNSRALRVPDSGVRAWLGAHARAVEQSEVDHYQVDFVAGDPIDDLGEDGLYAQQNRLMRFAFGSTEEGITERDTAWPSESIRECVDYGHITTPEEGTAEVSFTVAEGCERTLSLAVHSMPGETFSASTADEQELLTATTGTFGPGDHALAVTLPVGGEGDG